MNEIEKAIEALHDIKQDYENKTRSSYEVFCCDALDTAIAALQAQLDLEREPEPLTLEQLKQMDGEPVYIIGGPDPDDRYWELSMDALDYIECRNVDAYGEIWAAYDRKLKED